MTPQIKIFSDNVDDLISLRQLSERLGCTYEAVTYWRVNQGLHCIRLGGTWYTSEGVLREWSIRDNPEEETDVAGSNGSVG